MYVSQPMKLHDEKDFGYISTTPYTFLKKYFIKNTPATSNINSKYANISSGSSRSVISLYELLQHYFPKLTWLNYLKVLLQVCIKLNLWMWYCCTTHKIVIVSKSYLYRSNDNEGRTYENCDFNLHDDIYNDIHVVTNLHDLDYINICSTCDTFDCECFDNKSYYINDLDFDTLIYDLNKIK